MPFIYPEIYKFLLSLLTGTESLSVKRDELLKQNLLMIEIFYENFIETTFSEQAATNLINLFAAFSGQFNLWIGFSAIVLISSLFTMSFNTWLSV